LLWCYGIYFCMAKVVRIVFVQIFVRRFQLALRAMLVITISQIA
jgi:hypothetical protein